LDNIERLTLAHSANEVDRPPLLGKCRHREDFLAPFLGAARDVPDRGLVIDDDAQDAADRHGLEGDAGADEGERADLADEVERRVTR
jgi:hypothetical protein